jgi:uncharacterized protein with PIN domain
MQKAGASIYFEGSLQEFPAIIAAGMPLLFPVRNYQSVKDIIESAGVPHTEVACIIVNNTPVDFYYHLKDNDQVTVYPYDRVPDAFVNFKLRNITPEPIRFVLDVHLGTLARYLRFCGFDSVYKNNFQDKQIVAIASGENRIVLTRDIGILKYSAVNYGYWIRSKSPPEQLREVIWHYRLCTKLQPFSRCSDCNSILEVVQKKEVLDKLEVKTRIFYHDFRRCTGCGKIYWKGSHFENLEKIVERICRPGLQEY